MKIAVYGAVAAAALSLGACAGMMSGGPGPAYPETAMTATPPVPPAAGFVMMAGGADLYEIQSSQLVLSSTQNADLRRFAQTMVDHHTGTTQTLTAAAREAGMTPPAPMLNPAQQAMMAALQSLQGVERDRLYMVQQSMAHSEALALHTGYSREGDDAALRRAAAAAVPIVTRHKADIDAMIRRG